MTEQEFMELVDFNEMKVKNIPRVKEIIIPPAPKTDEEILEAVQNRENLKNVVVDMLYRYYKNNPK